MIIKTRYQNGITLIALVVTIVVLLILAAVSIATLVGENGIITQANESKEQSIIGEEKDLISVAYNGAKIQKLGKEVTDEDINEQFTINQTKATATLKEEGKIQIKFEETKHIYIIDFTEGTKIEFVESETDTDEDNITFYIATPDDYETIISTVKRGTTWIEFAKRLRVEGFENIFPDSPGVLRQLIWGMVVKADLDNMGEDAEMRTRW